MTPAILRVAGFVNKSHHLLVHELNIALDKYGVMLVTWIPDAIYRSRDQYRSNAERKATCDALQLVFGNQDGILDQYLLAWEWKERMVAYVHLSDNSARK